jgi:hypothetical protein
VRIPRWRPRRTSRTEIESNGSAEGARVSDLPGTNPALEAPGPGPAIEERRFQETVSPRWRSDSARPWCCPDACSPSRWAQGVCGRWIRLERSHAARRAGLTAARAKNPGISLRTSAPRERPPREGKPTSDEDATRRRKRVWGTGTVEEAGKGEAPIPRPPVKWSF